MCQMRRMPSQVHDKKFDDMYPSFERSADGTSAISFEQVEIFSDRRGIWKTRCTAQLPGIAIAVVSAQTNVALQFGSLFFTFLTLRYMIDRIKLHALRYGFFDPNLHMLFKEIIAMQPHTTANSMTAVSAFHIIIVSTFQLVEALSWVNLNFLLDNIRSSVIIRCDLLNQFFSSIRDDSRW